MPNADHHKPQRYHHGNLRNALIQAGLELLSEGGAAALDLRKVARRVGVSQAAPYSHFADKQALIASITEEGFHRLAKRIQNALEEASADTLGQLQALARAYVSFAQENPWLMREMFSGLAIDRNLYPTLIASTHDVLKMFMRAIKHGQETNTIVKGDIGELGAVLWSLLHGIAILIIEKQTSPYTDDPESVEHFIHRCVQMLYNGLGSLSGNH
ncbi:TetR/AcrR family transcriptional regulator [Ktedonospora formicarum]|uniref:TetR family transcriptional regulator n=1 Tax=Ktedonospora formicarum TaxID=2778364 RepID=A0A8J3I9P5_9CHLR|nr:TetR/AcrR family transcriptional regulator [Ktedonospora formicarum]GHO48333.1 TetR family transcriptional regulator [Ktedonospora formicarum]